MMIAVLGLLCLYPSVSIDLNPSKGGSLTLQSLTGAGFGELRPEAGGLSLRMPGDMTRGGLPCVDFADNFGNSSTRFDLSGAGKKGGCKISWWFGGSACGSPKFAQREAIELQAVIFIPDWVSLHKPDNEQDQSTTNSCQRY
jgi:hypothetical protein